MKKILTLFFGIALTLTLSGCWSGEISVDTKINGDGSGTRTIVLAVMDDTLSEDPITNPNDPEETEGQGPVINSVHITGGVSAIQTWLDDNAPTWMTVEEMTTEGYTRYFTLKFDFKDFDDYLEKTSELVNLSPNHEWTTFDETEIPSFDCEGSFTKTCTFKESKLIVEATLDWAIDGIWTDIYDEASLAGFVEKANIAKLAGYKVSLGDKEISEESYYDAEAADGDTNKGAVVYVTSDNFEVSNEFTNTNLYLLVSLGVLVIVGVSVGLVFKFKK